MKTHGPAPLEAKDAGIPFDTDAQPSGLYLGKQRNMHYMMGHLRRDAAAAQAGQREQARVVPAAYMAVRDQARQGLIP